LPSEIATGRSGNVSPSISIVAPTRAWSRNSLATRRMLAASTSQMPLAENDQVVQKLAPNGSDQSLHIRIFAKDLMD